MTAQVAYVCAFLLACASLGISTGIMVSYWPWRPAVYPMGHPIYFKRGVDLLGFYRRDETIRIAVFLWSSVVVVASLVLIAVCIIKVT